MKTDTHDGPAVILYSLFISINVSHAMFLAQRDFCAGVKHGLPPINSLN